VDICGVIGMYALQLASGTPGALLDWNKTYAEDPGKAGRFHCRNLPRHFFAGTVGRENTYATGEGPVKACPMRLARFSTNDSHGNIHGYAGGGRFTGGPLTTFGGAGAAGIPNLRRAATRHLQTRLRTPWGRQQGAGGIGGAQGGHAVSLAGACITTAGVCSGAAVGQKLVSVLIKDL
jgi:hypothetical protein